MIDLIWHEIRQVSVDEDTLYSSLLYVYRTYIGDEDDDIDEIIDGILNYIGNKNDDIDKIIENIQDYIEDYIEELIKYASPYEYSVGDIDSEDITDLVTGDEFLEKFKKWYLND